jgi:Glycine zipper 2TM domain
MRVNVVRRSNPAFQRGRGAVAAVAAIAAALLGGCVAAPVRTVGVPPPRPVRLFVYPARGQSPDQQARDRYECHVWAVKQTGVDPSRATGPYQRVVVQPAPGAATVAGAVGGAIVGSMIGGDEHGGVGALVGGVAGAMLGSAADANAQAQADASRRQIEDQRAEANAYRRAISACLDARGYTVS